MEHRLQEIRDLRKSVEHHEAGIKGQIESFERDLRSHLWVMEDFVEPASEGLVRRLDEARKLLNRLAAVEKGYEALPREEEPEVVPETVARTA